MNYCLANINDIQMILIICLLIAIRGCVLAFSEPITGRPERYEAALEQTTRAFVKDAAVLAPTF